MGVLDELGWVDTLAWDLTAVGATFHPGHGKYRDRAGHRTVRVSVSVPAT